MRQSAALGLVLCVIGGAALATGYNPFREADGVTDVPGAVLFCGGTNRVARPCGGGASPLATLAGPVNWQAAASLTIGATGTYQSLFAAGAATHGGLVTDLCAPGSAPLWVDVTGTLGTVLSGAAQPIYPAASASSAPGAMRFPGTTHGVTIYGQAGCSFAAYGG